jgi:hypothetical protein
MTREPVSVVDMASLVNGGFQVRKYRVKRLSPQEIFPTITSEKKKIVYILSELCGFTNASIALHLSISETYVATLRASARKILNSTKALYAK